jgi:citrate synthase
MVELGEVDIKRGLKDVYFDTSQASFIDGSIGKLLYRGYSIHDLAEKSTFEETSYLLLHGKLPTSKELAEFDSLLKDARSLPPEILEVIRLTMNAHPMDVLRTAMSALAAVDPDTEDNSQEATLRKGVRLTAQAATIVAAHHRIRTKQEPITPSRTLGHAGNFLYMLFGQEPTEDEAKTLDKDFILHAEHGSNASAFGARVTASTVSDLHAAVTTGVGVLKGPLHGGAAEKVREMTLEIGDESRAEEYVAGVIANGGRIMGFGHRVYKAEDPRARHMREECLRLGEARGDPTWFRILSAVAKAMKPYESRGIFQNVDFWSGAIYTLLAVPDDLFITIFAIGRIPGWTVQVLEQFDNNILIRPLTQYIGPMDVPYVPMEQRS